MQKRDSFYTFIVVASIVLITQVVIGFIIYFSFDDWSERASFGDMFGTINTLFSGLAFAGVIYAIFLQRKELSLQREELQLTRKELEKAANAQQRSTDLLRQQLDLAKDDLNLQSKLRDRKNEINLRLDSHGGSSKELRLQITNVGGIANHPEISPLLSGYDLKINKSGALHTNQSFLLTIKQNSGTINTFKFKITYFDILDEERSKVFTYIHGEGLFVF